MEELIVNKLNILLLSFLLTACGNSTTEPKEQQEFKSLISSLSNEYKTAKNSDNDLEIKDFENKFKKELKDTNRTVSSWVGSFVSSTLNNEKLTIELSNGDQKYYLILVDPKVIEYSTQFDLHQNQIIDWKNQLLEQSINIFSRPTAQQEPEIDLKALHAKIGHQALQIDFLEGALRKTGQLSGKK